jgi:ParB family chromosome partitioning protein
MLRSRVDSADLMALAASIKRNGIAQPLFVRVLSEEPRLYELFSGYRRWRAALVAEIDYLPVIVFGHLSEPTTLELSVLENSNRRDMSIIEEARAFHVLVEKFGRTATQIASLTGRSVNQVVNMLTLVALPEEVKHSLRSGQIGFAHARAVARAADPICLARRVIAEKLTVRETELLADQLRPRAGRTDLAPTASDDQTQIEGVGRIDTESPIRFAESGTRRDLTTLQAALRATAGAGIEVGTDCDDTRLVIDGRSREDVTRIVSILRDALWLLRMNTLVRSEGVRTARDLCKE